MVYYYIFGILLSFQSIILKFPSQFKGNFVDGRNNSKYGDVAPLNGIPINHIFECVNSNYRT